MMWYDVIVIYNFYYTLDGTVLFWISQLGIKAVACLSGAIGHDDISAASMRLTSQAGLGDNNVINYITKTWKRTSPCEFPHTFWKVLKRFENPKLESPQTSPIPTFQGGQGRYGSQLQNRVCERCAAGTFAVPRRVGCHSSKKTPQVWTLRLEDI